MKVLYIAEKASVGKALSAVLSGERVKGSNHIRCGDDVVAWASGHLLRLFEPEEYNEGLKKWTLDNLPIVPERWKYRPLERTKSLLDGIGTLMKDADVVVNAGDADREGSLLIDEILEHFGWKGPAKRLRINDVNPDAIRKALKEMKDNSEYRGESLAGKARSYADWLAGMNLTRYCTKHADMAGYDVMFSVGRVQTPTLGLVVKRDRDIENFVSRTYYALSATLELNVPDFSNQEKRKITGHWVRDDKSVNEGMASKEDCKTLAEKVRGRGEITGVNKKARHQGPPLTYNLAKLQMDVSRLYDVTDALKHVQSLYEQGYVTYPRSDCQYIPEGHHEQARLVLDAITSARPGFLAARDILAGVDARRKSQAWDDSKITEHHAIIPTVKVPIDGILSDIERKIYDLIAKRYLLQFLPDHEYEQTTIDFTAGGERFRVSGRTVLVPGWKRWGTDEKSEGDEEHDRLSMLPSVSVGEIGEAEPFVEEKKTVPPKRFTYDALLGAMNSIHLYVENPEIRKRLKELDGIGTSATQENIIALLFDRGYIEKRKKSGGSAQIFSTPAGRALINLLSAGGKSVAFVTPDLTALWERDMTRIEKGELSLESFVGEAAKMVEEIVKEPLPVPEISELPRKKKRLAESAIEADCPLKCGKKARRYEGKYGPFWKCPCSPEVTFKDVEGVPALKEERLKAPCPVKACKGTAERIRKKDGSFFWKCQVCKNFFNDESGQPSIQEKRASRQSQKKKAAT
ncbi:MAG: DNA topoisomerase 3 [Synergistaceae bacterium]|nr:DNA topoisomerase 3 [Synergistaceae bacterium]